MKRGITGLSFIIIFQWLMISAAIAGGGGRAGVELPITVRIIDFETTKQICGQDIPPVWCPAHLLKEPESNDFRDNFTTQYSAIDSENKEYISASGVIE